MCDPHPHSAQANTTTRADTIPQANTITRAKVRASTDDIFPKVSLTRVIQSSPNTITWANTITRANTITWANTITCVFFGHGAGAAGGGGGGITNSEKYCQNLYHK